MPVAKQHESTYTLVPPGTHPARCYGMVSLGTQIPLNPQYKPSFKVIVLFEFPNEQIEIQGVRKPMGTTVFLNVYLGSPTKPSNTAKFLTAWRGREFTKEELEGFDLAKVVGAPCLLNIVHQSKDGKNRESVASISPLPKGMTMPPQVNPSVVYEIEQGRDAAFQSLPEWQQKMIAACQEWTIPRAADSQTDAPEDNGDTSVPF